MDYRLQKLYLVDLIALKYKDILLLLQFPHVDL